MGAGSSPQGLGPEPREKLRVNAANAQRQTGRIFRVGLAAKVKPLSDSEAAQSAEAVTALEQAKVKVEELFQSVCHLVVGRAAGNSLPVGRPFQADRGGLGRPSYIKLGTLFPAAGRGSSLGDCQDCVFR